MTGDTTWGPPFELDENGGKVVAGPVRLRLPTCNYSKSMLK